MKRARIPFSDEELAFIEARQAMSRVEICQAFCRVFQRQDVQPDHIRALCVRRGWTTRRPWSAEDDAILRKDFPHMSTKKLGAQMQRSESAINQRAHGFGLKKTEAYLASPDACRLRRGDNVGLQFRFVKGQTPPNKGVKRPGWAPGRMRETQFLKGQPPQNWKPIGSTRVVDGYHYTKISDVRGVPYTVNWKPTHVLRWEAQHGPIPENHVLKSYDSNRQNTDPSNWQLISRSLLPRLSGGRVGRVGYDVAPASLKPTIMAVAQLEHAVRVRKRTNAKVA